MNIQDLYPTDKEIQPFVDMYGEGALLTDILDMATDQAVDNAVKKIALDLDDIVQGIRSEMPLSFIGFPRLESYIKALKNLTNKP